jgi:hypothetical protein
MKLKKRPEVNTDRLCHYEQFALDIPDGTSILEFTDMLRDSGHNPATTRIVFIPYRGYQIEVEVRESEKDYRRRQKNEQKALQKYNEWYEANRADIEAELVRRECLEEDMHAARIAKLREKREALEAELANLES